MEPPITPSSIPEYAMIESITSQEEGIAVDLSLIPVPVHDSGGDDDNDAAAAQQRKQSQQQQQQKKQQQQHQQRGRGGGNESPFDEEQIDSLAVAAFSADLFAESNNNLEEEGDSSSSSLCPPPPSPPTKGNYKITSSVLFARLNNGSGDGGGGGASLQKNELRTAKNSSNDDVRRRSTAERDFNYDAHARGTISAPATAARRTPTPTRTQTPMTQSSTASSNNNIKLAVSSAAKRGSRLDNNDDNKSSSSSSSQSYYTQRPKNQSTSLSFTQRLREYRHTNCIMTPLSTLVLLAILLSSLITMIFTVPQLLIGIILGPFVKRNFWLVEFLYRWNVAKWGHVKIMEIAAKSRGGGGGNNIKKKQEKKSGDKGTKKQQSKNSKSSPSSSVIDTSKLGGHSSTLHQRITVVPGRVYIHPIPQFMDNISYLIVCTPPLNNNDDSHKLPIIGILIDPAEPPKLHSYLEQIYEQHYIQQYPRNKDYRNTIYNNRNVDIELYALVCTHSHHDHTAGVGELRKDICKMRLNGDGGDGNVRVTSGINNKNNNNKSSSDIYQSVPGNILVVGGAVENVPHCNLFVKNGCFIPLPCISVQSKDDNGGSSGVTTLLNDMNDVVSMEVISVPSHTRGSVVYALRNRAAPDVNVGSIGSASSQNNNHHDHLAPLQSHLFTGDAIFTGGGGVPFEADLEFARDNFIKNPKRLKKKNGSSTFRPGAGVLSMERCFAEVLTRAMGPWSSSESPSSSSSSNLPQDGLQITSQLDGLLESSDRTSSTTSLSSSTTSLSQTLLYPGHEYTTDLLLRQFDPKTIPHDGTWTRVSPSTFFEVASHYLVSAHKRALPPGQKLLTLPTPLERERVVNPNFRSLNRRGEAVVNALKLWYEFGAQNLIPDRDDDDGEHNGVVPDGSSDYDVSNRGNNTQQPSVFTTVYSNDLNKIVEDLRSGMIDPASAADRIESIQGRLDERIIGRRPIPSTLPSHKNVYLGVVALVVLGSAPSAVTVSDATIMNMAPPMESTDRILVSKRRLIAALDGLGILSKHKSPRLDDIIHLLWREARFDDGSLELDIEDPNNGKTDSDDDQIELGLLKLALFGVAFNQPSKFCLPCGIGGGNTKPQYDDDSWVITSKLRRTNGELVRHDADNCLLCKDVSMLCPQGK